MLDLMRKPFFRWCLMAIAGLLQAAMLIGLYKTRVTNAFEASHDDLLVFCLPFAFGIALVFLIARGLTHRLSVSLAIACVSEFLGMLVCLNRYGS
jgi:hypothetical protein